MKLSLSTWFLSIFLALAAVTSAWAAPGVLNLTTPVLPANASRTAINSLSASTGTPTRYNIVTVPTGGTLYVNGTAVTAARALTPTEATQLSFLPSGTAGNYSFTFSATDGNGTSATNATYAISVGQASCGQAAGLDFSTRTTNEDWKSRSATSSNVTISTSGYSANAGSVADEFQVENRQYTASATPPGTLSPSLTWYVDYAARAASTSQVTFTFSRALTGFSIVVQDIDATTNNLTTSTFIDQVQFDGYVSSTATTPIALVAANVKLGTTNTFSGNNRVTGNNASTSTPTDNVIVTFPQAITKLTLTYRNTQTANADPAVQAIGIPSFGWCAEADIAMGLTGPTRAQASSQVMYSMTTTNNGPDVPTSVIPTLQLPTGLAGVTPSTGGTYSTSTGLVTFAAISSLAVNSSVTNTVAFTMPASNAVSGTAAFTSSVLDNTTANNTFTLSTAQNRAPVASDVTNSPAILSSTTSQTNIASFNASDPDATTGNTTIVSYTIVTLPTAAQGVLYVNGTAATAGQVITVATTATTSSPGYQLSFVPNGTFAGNAAFTYKAIDDVGVSSNTANYYVPVTAGADLLSTVTGQTTAVEGQSKTFSITTTNNGPATSTNVVPTLTLSSKPGFSSVTVTNGSYDASTGIVTFNTTASLASGASVVNSVILVVAASPTSFTLTAANTSATADPVATNNNGTAPGATLTVAVSAIGPAGTASACATPGRDSSPTLTTNPDTYYPATNQTVAVGATSLSVGAAMGTTTTPIAAGDLLLVMQMQGADIDYSNTDSYGDGVAGGAATSYLNNANFTAGQYEYVVAAGTVPVGGGTVTTTTGLKYSYQNASATTTTGQRRFQVVRIPQYKNLTISGTVAPSAWDGSTGGILALDVTGQLTFASGATLDASGKGFRGGAGQKLTGTTGLTGTDYRAVAPTSVTTVTGAHAMKGEGIVGTPRYVNTGAALVDTGVDGYPSGSAGRGAPGNGGGGGTDANPTANSLNSGGGGGGNGARGGHGGNAWSSGAAVGGEVGVGFSAPSSSRLILGGGGGAGVTNDGTGGGPSAGYASSGAAGGGIVLVRTGSVSGSGTVLANGASASNAVLADGSGGGGAGGSIVVTANNTASLSSLILAANGGTGGTNTPGSATAHGPGGGGGGGIVLTNAAPNSASVAGGASGTTTGSVAYGATAGVTGIANGQISNSIAGSAAGINCSVDVTATTSATATATAGQTVSLSTIFANNGGVAAANVTRTVTLASGDVLNPVTSVTAQGSSSISSPDPTTGTVTITYPSVSSLAGGNSSTFGISYVAPGTTSVVATSTATTTSTEPVTDNNTSAATTAISGYADVVTFVFGLASSTTGRPTATYSAVFANNGPAAAANVTRTVTLPSGATLTSAQLQTITNQGGSYNSGTQVIDFGTVSTLDNHAANAFQFNYTASNTSGATSVTSTITTTTAEDANNGTGTAPNQSAFTVTNNATSDLATNGVTVSASTVLPGQQASFTLNFINYGPADAASALRYAQLTPGLSGVSVTNNGTYDPATGVITYPSITLANGASAPSTVTFTAPAVGPVNVSGSLSGGGSSASSGIFGNNQATGSIAVTPVADVATTLSGPTTIVTGNLVTFAVTTANSGPAAAAAVVQTVQLPTGLSGVFPSNNGTYNANNGVVTFPALATLPVGAIINNTISFPMPTAAFTASAAVTTTTTEASGTTANNAATAATTNPAAATTDQANVYNMLTLSDKNLAPGAALTFTIVTSNNGPNPALNVAQQLSLPPGLSVSSISNSGTYNATTGLVTFPVLASQASGASASATNTVVLTAPATGPLVAMASVTSTTSDPVPDDNIVSRIVNILSVADVATTLVGPGVAASTQVPTFTVTTSNKGLVPALNVVQTVAISAGFDPANVTTTGGGVYDPATGLITWPTVASLGVEEVKTYTYSYLAPAIPSTDANNPRTIVSQASVTSSTPDAVGTNNAAAVATDIKWNSDVSVAVAGPAVALLGNSITFTVSTINNGPAPASNVATSVQIAPSLTNVSASGGGVYDSSTGIITFPTIATQVAGPTGAVTYTITHTVPDQPIIGVSAAANNSANDIFLTNNAATLVIPVSPRTSTLADLQTTITSNISSQQAGQPIVLTAKAINAGPGTSSMREQVTLPAGLSNVAVTNSDGTALANAYDAASGAVTFPTATGQTSGTTLTYQITVNNPGNDPLVATASINGNLSDPTPANNTQTVSVTIVPVADVATRLNGPATMLPGGLTTYQVVTVNNGPSPANAVVQTVQLPTGLSSSVAVSGGGSYDSSSGVVTFPKIATQAVGLLGEVTNTISFTFPTTATTLVSTVTSGTGENGATANNTSPLTTTLTNQLPLASTLTNRLQSPEGNTAAPLTLSALTGFDPDGSLASYTIATLPAGAAGTLALRGTAVQVGQVISNADAANLTFDPASSFVGNAFFTFSTTDNKGATSTSALYTIPVGQDNASVYTTTPVKGISNQYQDGDVIAKVFDANAGAYDAAAAVTDNGVRTASVDNTTLPPGTQLDPVSGLITVYDRTLLVAGTYPVSITTIDANGGVTTQNVSLKIGAYPLPVTLTRFDAEAVGLDGNLSWATAQERDNAGFQVERSFDGTSFEALGFMAGAGTSTRQLAYSFIDAGVGRQHPGPVYYRLQQRDLAGQITYSPVRTVAFVQQRLALSATLYPNPAAEQTTLDLTALPNGPYQVSIVDMAGRMVQTHTLAGGLAHTLLVGSLPTGTYVVVISDGKLKFSQHLIKQ
ncbi:MAG: T9SS type A sorting domain-containing protein [Janthinobacterium lividum]